MTLPSRLAALKALREKATPGPWRVEKRGDTVITICAPVMHEADDPRVAYFYGAFADKVMEQIWNAELAVAAVNALPDILKLVEGLEELRNVLMVSSDPRVDISKVVKAIDALLHLLANHPTGTGETK